LKKAGVVLDDNKSIFDSGIVANTVVTADYNTIAITVTVDGTDVAVSVDPDNTVATIKDQVKAQKSIDIARYKLVKGGVALQDTAKIADQGIVAGTKLVADFNTIQISVTMGSQTYQISVDPDNKVSTIKTALKEKT
jgi:predicted DNA binding protein